MFTKHEQGAFLNALERAISETLHKTFGRAVEVVLSPPGGDLVLAIALGGPPARFEVAVEIKSTMTPSTVAALAARHPGGRVMAACARLTPTVMDACRQLNVACADVDGNLFLRWDSGAVDIQGRPATASRELAAERGDGGRLASRSGLQVIFTLMAMPELQDAPFRWIASASGSSLGSVATVMRELERLGYVVQRRHGRALQRGSELLDLWVDGYRLRLVDRLRLGTFDTDDREWWKTVGTDPEQVGGQWSGETALWAAGRDLRPARGVLYTDALPRALITRFRMRRDQNSDAAVEFRQRFWDSSMVPSGRAVPAPLVYADLLADGDPRLVEAAAEFRRADDDLRRLDES